MADTSKNTKNPLSLTQTGDSVSGIMQKMEGSDAIGKHGYELNEQNETNDAA